MSKANGRITAMVLAGLAAGLLFLGRATAGDPDLLKDEAARRALLAQQAERDIRDARDDAYKTARTQPGEALKRIQKLLVLVDANDYLSDEKRADLTALLKRDLVDIQKMADAASNPNVGSGFHPVGPDPRAEEQKKIIDSAVSRITASKEALADAA